MKFLPVIKKAEKLLIDNSPAILTVVAVAGSLTTAFLTGKAALKSAEILGLEADRKDRSAVDSVKLVWKLYIPAASSAALTVVSIVGANQIGTRRAAAVAAAYSISEKAFGEYKDKVAEKFGAGKERSMSDDISRDRINRNPLNGRDLIITGNGDILCYEEFAGRYFTSSVETLRKAMNDTNQQVLNNSYASLSDFYSFAGMPRTSYSDEVGWTSDDLLDLEFSTNMTEDGRPCISIRYNTMPIRDYFRFSK